MTTKESLSAGHHDGQTVHEQSAASIIVLGPARRRNRLSFISQSINSHAGAAIIASSSSWLYDHTKDARNLRGSVQSVVLGSVTTTDLTWSVLDRARSWQGALEISHQIVFSCPPSTGQEWDDLSAYKSAAERLLASHLFAAAANGYSTLDVTRWIMTQEEFEVRSLLQAAGVEEAITMAEANWQREDRSRSQVYTLLEPIVAALSRLEGGARNTPLRTDFLTGDEHNTLYLNDFQFETTAPVLLSAIANDICQAAWTWNEEMPLHLMVVIDDARRMGALWNLSRLAESGARNGINVLTTWRDVSDLIACYGRSANAVIDSHDIKLITSGISDDATNAYIASCVPTTDRDTIMDKWRSTNADQVLVITDDLIDVVDIAKLSDD